ncbi:hypothetical protein ONZ45_g3476 [Pleurotus djamor]|nr:hypothetical protein ONZ45_g3476 [Pleurotus djamor]
MPPPVNPSNLTIPNTHTAPFVDKVLVRQIFDPTSFLAPSTRTSLPMGAPTTDTSVTIVISSRTAATTTVAIITNMPQPSPDHQAETYFESNTFPPPVVDTSFSIPQQQATVAPLTDERPANGNAPATPETSNPQVPVNGEDESGPETTMTSPAHPIVITTTGMGIPILTGTSETTGITRESSQDSDARTRQARPSHSDPDAPTSTEFAAPGEGAHRSNSATKILGMYKRAFVVVALTGLLIS